MQLRNAVRLSAVLSSAVLLAACAPGDGQRPATAPRAEPPVAASGAAADREEITVDVHSLEQIEQLIARHSGKVVVLDLWALW